MIFPPKKQPLKRQKAFEIFQYFQLITRMAAMIQSFNELERALLFEKLRITTKKILKCNQTTLQDVSYCQKSSDLESITLSPLMFDYFWKWDDGEDFQYYPDHINQLIYEETVLKMRFGSFFSFQFIPDPFQKPFTHKIDFIKNTITKLDPYNLQEPIKLDLDSLCKKSRDLYKWVRANQILGKKSMEISMKQYEIRIGDESYQRNLETCYNRQIIREDNNRYMIILSDQLYREKGQHQSYLYLFEGPNIQAIQGVMKYIKDTLQDSLKVKIYNFPAFQTEVRKQLELELLKDAFWYCRLVDDRIKTCVCAFDDQHQNLERLLSLLQTTMSSVSLTLQNRQYPKEWGNQDRNLEIFRLSPLHTEYIKVAENFSKTLDRTRILAINRIQNKALHHNYEMEKLNMFQRSGRPYQIFQTEEEDQLLWHGVKNQHPKIIYEGDKEGFNIAYSNEKGRWGMAIYFSVRADYSINYCYERAGIKYMLCCKVALGNQYDYQFRYDQHLKRALSPNGEEFDSLTGVVDSKFGTTRVHMLYSMDVRRAYPAYEVQFV